MWAQGKTTRNTNRSSWLLHLRAAYIHQAHRVRQAFARVKQTLQNCFEAQPQPEDKRIHDEAYFWVEFYNTALLESDPRRIPKTIQYALKAVEQRRGALQVGTMHSAEWNLLQYAELVLTHMAKTSAPFLWTRQQCASGDMEEKKAA
jgi:hypothetical protein